VKGTKQETWLYRPVSSFTEEEEDHKHLTQCNTSVWRESLISEPDIFSSHVSVGRM